MDRPHHLEPDPINYKVLWVRELMRRGVRELETYVPIELDHAKEEAKAWTAILRHDGIVAVRQS
jgi:hypothetical protein